MRNLTIDHLPADTLTPYARNARTHSKKQIRQIAHSIETFGWTNPILVDSAGGIVAGHGRVAAAKLLGIDMVPTICLEDLSEAQIRAYVIADNRLAENAGWDREMLAIEFQGLIELDLEFDVTSTGFEMPEIDILIGEFDATREDEAGDEIPTLADGPPVTRPGDIWHLGRHRLICGDATDRDICGQLLSGALAQMVFTDPPYNVPIDGHVSGLGMVKHREFAMASGEMTQAQFTAFLTTVFENLAAHSADGAIQFICMDWRHIGELIAAGSAAFTELKNMCVWAKTNGGMGSLYRSQHELVFVFKTGSAPHINNVELGRHGRNRTNLWSYAGINSFGKDRDAELALHPTVKPVALVADAILDCSRRGGIVLDAFAGSGTTLIAAEKMGRCGYGIELDPHYCDVIVRRFAGAFEFEAVHAVTGETFSETERRRRKENVCPESDNNIPNNEVDHVEG
ncbi:MAG: ParB N-terminal domain-containing protein [Rhodospirillales bacterium]|nr:ParB N-terminal domain-containing protein [Rhodospirillales bacterium]